jgi:acetyltransferase-like isoleucine patch superfamily enzyme
MSYLQKIRNREGPVADFIYRSYKATLRSGVGPVPGLHRMLAYERATRSMIFGLLRSKLYYEPLFKLQLENCGAGLSLVGGIPVIMGDLRVRLGENVTMHGSSVLIGAKVCEEPRLIIGSRTHLGSFFSAIIGRNVEIGDDVLISNRVSIYTYDSHPLDPELRRQGLGADAASSRPVCIEDNAWICAGAFIMKGVTVGESSVVAAGSVVVKDVPPRVVVAGNPARVVKELGRGSMPEMRQQIEHR